jgi:hypothetical protein
MGQYRLWLQHREIDQLLRAQLKTLVNELARVDEQISLLANPTSQGDNVIIRALLKECQLEPSPVPVPDVPIQAISSPVGDLSLIDSVDLQEQTPGSVSSALFTWGHLPKFASPGMQNLTRDTALSQPVPPTPLSAENLLPTDIQTFVAAHGPAALRTNPPRRLSDIICSSHEIPNDSSISPMDQQSVRINQGVERWFERRTHFPQESSGDQEEQEEQKESIL